MNSDPNPLITFYRDNRHLALHMVRSYGVAAYNVEDVLQDAFIRLLRTWDRFDSEKGSLKKWVKDTIRWAASDHRKTHSRAEVYLERYRYSWFPSPPPSYDFYLHKAIMQLKPTHREILYLYFFQDLSVVEIAQQRRVHHSAVSKQLDRALENLQKVLDVDVAKRGTVKKI